MRCTSIWGDSCGNLYVFWFPLFCVCVAQRVSQVLYKRCSIHICGKRLCIYKHHSISALHKGWKSLLEWQSAVVASFKHRPTATWAVLAWNELYYPLFFCWTATPQWEFGLAQLTVNDAVWLVFFFFCLSQAWGGSIIEKSAGPFSSSSKSFAYILCSHTNHQLSGLAVFVLEDCMAVAVSRLILAVTVKERRNFLLFCMRVTLIHLLYGSVNEIWWLKSLAAEGEGTFGKKKKKKKTDPEQKHNPVKVDTEWLFSPKQIS